MILVVGSLNLDYVVHVTTHPKPGETVLGGDVATHPGGKGANQAVAAARAGAKTRMLGAVGSDDAGAFMRANLEREGIDIAHLKTVSGSSGAAFITLNDTGQNSIVVSPGANGQCHPTDLSPTAFVGARVVLLQLETPIPTVLKAAELGRAAGARVVLNLAPAQALSKAQLEHVSLLVVNEFEAGVLSGKAPGNPQEALIKAQNLRSFAPEVVITLGANGAVYADSSGVHHVPSHVVQVVDTTAAGDAFIGALAASLAEGSSLGQAVQRGVVAGTLACTKAGAQPSLPLKLEVDAVMQGEQE